MPTNPRGKMTQNLTNGSTTNPRDQRTVANAKAGMSRRGSTQSGGSRTSSSNGGQVLTTGGYKYPNP